MILQPALNGFVLALVFVPLLAITVLGAVRAGGPGARLAWVGRAAFVLLVLAVLLRPGLPGGTAEVLTTETDVVLVVDTTASIIAEDWGPEGEPRLVGVREDIDAIVAQYPGARFALISFDAAAVLRMPLSTDTTALHSEVALLTPEVTSRSRGSSISEANDLLAKTLATAAATAPDRSRMVFYFGDGEQTAENSPESFAPAGALVDSGAVLGYGTAAGGPMRLTTGGVDGADGGYIEYRGSPALSVIDEDTLRAIAGELGVEYELRAAGSAPTLPEAPQSARALSGAGSVGAVTELYWIPALAAALLAAVELARGTAVVVRTRRLARQRGTSA